MCTGASMRSYGQADALWGAPQPCNSSHDVPEHLRYNEKQLTSAIKNATTAERLQQLAEIHADTINQIHIAAVLTKLANISKRAPQQPVAVAASASIYAARSAASHHKLLQQLQNQLLQQGCRGHGPRGLANILWALAKLQCNPDLALLRVLVCNFYHQLPAAVPQDVANVLWGVAQLTRDYGEHWTAATNSNVRTNSSSSRSSSSSSSRSSSISSGSTDTSTPEPRAATTASAGNVIAASDQTAPTPTPAAAAAAAASDSAATAEVMKHEAVATGDWISDDGIAAAGGQVTSGLPVTTPAGKQQQQQEDEEARAPSSSAPPQQQSKANLQPHPQQDDAPCASPHAGSSSSSSNSHPYHNQQQQPLLTLLQVYHLLQRLCQQLHVTAAQTISNVCWALTVLQQCNGWCMCPCLEQVKDIVEAFAYKLRDTVPGHIPRVIRCMVQLATACHNHAEGGWIHWQPTLLARMLRRLVVHEEGVKQYHVAAVMQDISQFGYLMLPAAQLQQITAAAAALQPSSNLSSNQPSAATSSQAAGVIIEFNNSGEATAAAPADERQLASEGESPVSPVSHQMAPRTPLPLLPDQQQQQQVAAQGDLPLDPGRDRSDIHVEDNELRYSDTSEEGDAASDRGSPTTPAAAAAAGGGGGSSSGDATDSAVVMDHVLPQLERVGLLQLYTAMNNLFPTGHPPLFKYVEGQAVPAATLPEDQLQYQSPPPEVLAEIQASPVTSSFQSQRQQQQHGSSGSSSGGMGSRGYFPGMVVATGQVAVAYPGGVMLMDEAMPYPPHGFYHPPHVYPPPFASHYLGPVPAIPAHGAGPRPPPPPLHAAAAGSRPRMHWQQHEGRQGGYSDVGSGHRQQQQQQWHQQQQQQQRHQQQQSGDRNKGQQLQQQQNIEHSSSSHHSAAAAAAVNQVGQRQDSEEVKLDLPSPFQRAADIAAAALGRTNAAAASQNLTHNTSSSSSSRVHTAANSVSSTVPSSSMEASSSSSGRVPKLPGLAGGSSSSSAQYHSMTAAPSPAAVSLPALADEAHTHHHQQQQHTSRDGAIDEGEQQQKLLTEGLPRSSVTVANKVTNKVTTASSSAGVVPSPRANVGAGGLDRGSSSSSSSMDAGSQQQHRQQQQQDRVLCGYTAAEIANAPVVFLQAADGQKKAYHQMPDGMLVPVYQQRKQQQRQQQQQQQGQQQQDGGHAPLLKLQDAQPLLQEIKSISSSLQQQQPGGRVTQLEGVAASPRYSPHHQPRHQQHRVVTRQAAAIAAAGAGAGLHASASDTQASQQQQQQQQQTQHNQLLERASMPATFALLQQQQQQQQHRIQQQQQQHRIQQQQQPLDQQMLSPAHQPSAVRQQQQQQLLPSQLVVNPIMTARTALNATQQQQQQQLRQQQQQLLLLDSPASSAVQPSLAAAGGTVGCSGDVFIGPDGATYMIMPEGGAAGAGSQHGSSSLSNTTFSGFASPFASNSAAAEAAGDTFGQLTFSGGVMTHPDANAGMTNLQIPGVQGYPSVQGYSGLQGSPLLQGYANASVQGQEFLQGYSIMQGNSGVQGYPLTAAASGGVQGLVNPAGGFIAADQGASPNTIQPNSSVPGSASYDIRQQLVLSQGLDTQHLLRLQQQQQILLQQQQQQQQILLQQQQQQQQGFNALQFGMPPAL